MPSRSLSPLRAVSGLPLSQTSRTITFSPLGGRGRTAPLRPARLAPIEADREDFLRWWSGLLMRQCGDTRGIVRVFCCTEQTARNWLEAFACPQGHLVDLAQRLWPDEFAARAAGAWRAA